MPSSAPFTLSSSSISCARMKSRGKGEIERQSSSGMVQQNSQQTHDPQGLAGHASSRVRQWQAACPSMQFCFTSSTPHSYSASWLLRVASLQICLGRGQARAWQWQHTVAHGRWEGTLPPAASAILLDPLCSRSAAPHLACRASAASRTSPSGRRCSSACCRSCRSTAAMRLRSWVTSATQPSISCARRSCSCLLWAASRAARRSASIARVSSCPRISLCCGREGSRGKRQVMARQTNQSTCWLKPQKPARPSCPPKLAGTNPLPGSQT